MRVSYVRPSPPGGWHYRLALSLHTRYTLDAEFSEVDLTSLSRPEAREILASIERRTGLTSAVLEHDAAPEDDD